MDSGQENRVISNKRSWTEAQELVFVASDFLSQFGSGSNCLNLPLNFLEKRGTAPWGICTSRTKKFGSSFTTDLIDGAYMMPCCSKASANWVVLLRILLMEALEYLRIVASNLATLSEMGTVPCSKCRQQGYWSREGLMSDHGRVCVPWDGTCRIQLGWVR